MRKKDRALPEKGKSTVEKTGPDEGKRARRFLRV